MHNAVEAGTSPIVSIGMPVFNGGRSIREALNSLLSQNFKDFELIISDNASTDDTESICREYLVKDDRIRYFRQPATTVSFKNFGYVLKQARGEYFMWAAIDDVWAPEFIEANLESFKKDDQIIASISKVRFLNKEVRHSDTYPLMDDMDRNILTYLRAPYGNSRFYALFKRKILSDCVDENYYFYAKDWEIVIKTLTYGKYYEVDRTLFYRNFSGTGKLGYMIWLISHFKVGMLDVICPMWKLTRSVFSDKRIPRYTRVKCAWPLLCHNTRYFIVSVLVGHVLHVIKTWIKQVFQPVLRRDQKCGA